MDVLNSVDGEPLDSTPSASKPAATNAHPGNRMPRRIWSKMKRIWLDIRASSIGRTLLSSRKALFIIIGLLLICITWLFNTIDLIESTEYVLAQFSKSSSSLGLSNGHLITDEIATTTIDHDLKFFSQGRNPNKFVKSNLILVSIFWDESISDQPLMAQNTLLQTLTNLGNAKASNGEHTIEVDIHLHIQPAPSKLITKEEYKKWNAFEWLHGEFAVDMEPQLTGASLIFEKLKAEFSSYHRIILWIPYANTDISNVMSLGPWMLAAAASAVEHPNIFAILASHAHPIEEPSASPRSAYLSKHLGTQALMLLRQPFLDLYTYYKEATVEVRLKDFEPFIKGLPGAPLARRNRNAQECTSLYGKEFLKERHRWATGLLNRTGYPASLSAQCTGREKIQGDIEFLTWASRFMHDFRLYTIIPAKHSEDAQTVDAPFTLSFDDYVDLDETRRSAHSNWYTQFRTEVDAIVNAAAAYGNAISLTVINKAFLPFAYSFYCNIRIAEYWPPGLILLVTNDREAVKGLEGLPRSQVQYFAQLAGAEGKGNEYKMAGYWSFMLSRTLLVNELLKRGIQIFLFDLDQVWLRNPWTYMNERIPSKGWDIIGTRGWSSGRGGEIQGNFLILRPTMKTRALWDDISRRFSAAYDACCSQVAPDTIVGGIEQDQYLLSHLLLFTDARYLFGLKVIQLDRDLFVDGMWYTPGKYKNAVSRHPISIQNNWVVGSAKKIDRAKKFGHWFWDSDTTCLHKRVAQVCELSEYQRKHIMAHEVMGLNSSHDVVEGLRPFAIVQSSKQITHSSHSSSSSNSSSKTTEATSSSSTSAATGNQNQKPASVVKRTAVHKAGSHPTAVVALTNGKKKSKKQPKKAGKKKSK